MTDDTIPTPPNARPPARSGLPRLVKRCIDLVLAGTALIVLGPLLVAVAIAVRLEMGSPVLFRQLRPGYRARPFTLVKFRTMRDAVGPDGRPMPDEQRITRFGRLLRRTSIDELPELWNVVRGEMSIVGPRPLLMAYLDRYTPDEARRHDVRPGLTGWAQIHGRRRVAMSDRFAFDVWYVDHWSLSLDLRIMWATVGLVLRRRGLEPIEGVVDPFQTERVAAMRQQREEEEDRS